MSSNSLENQKLLVEILLRRRYPWGIQRLVSIHQLPHESPGGTLDQVKSQVPSPHQIFISEGRRRGGVLWTPHSSNTWVGVPKEFCTKNFYSLACSCIADSRSHTMCGETKKWTWKKTCRTNVGHGLQIRKYGLLSWRPLAFRFASSNTSLFLVIISKDRRFGQIRLQNTRGQEGAKLLLESTEVVICLN